jgi:cytochrome c-type biogenesis protein CcmH/NrfG
VGHDELALESLRQAVELDPNNPRYLDMLVEFGVKCGNKEIAEEAWQQLRMVNSENGKMTALRDSIDQMPS